MMRNASEEERLASISEKCDFFSLGIILYEMLTGKKPFQADDYYKQEVIELPLKYDLPALSKNNPKIPTAVENIIFRCIACKDVDLKFQYNNVNEIIRDVDNVTSDPLKAKTEPLLKPYKNRTFQSGVVFDLEKEKNKLKAYHLP